MTIVWFNRTAIVSSFQSVPAGSLEVTLTRRARRDQIGNVPSSNGMLKVIHLQQPRCVMGTMARRARMITMPFDAAVNTRSSVGQVPRHGPSL
jgi:hypothetical protein